MAYRPTSKAEAYRVANLEGKASKGLRWATMNLGVELVISRDDASCGSHSGACDDDIAALREVPYLKEQLDAIDPETLAKELKGYGAWDATELADHDANLSRCLWLLCADITEGEH